MKNIKLLVSMLVLFTGTALSGIAQAKLQLHLNAGDKWYCEQKINTNRQIEVMDNQMEISEENILGTVYEVLTADKGVYDIKLTFSNIKFKGKNPMSGEEIGFDSQKKEDIDGELGKNAKNAIGQSFVFTIDANSRKIVSIKERPQKNEVGSSMLSQGPEPAVYLFPQNDEQLYKTVEKIFGGTIPDTSAAAGLNWNRDFTETMGKISKISNVSNSISRIEGNVIYIDIASKTSLESTSGGAEQMDEVQISGMFTGTGISKVDQTTGLLTENKFEERGNEEVTTPMGVQTGKVTITVLVTLTKL